MLVQLGNEFLCTVAVKTPDHSSVRFLETGAVNVAFVVDCAADLVVLFVVAEEVAPNSGQGTAFEFEDEDVV